MPICDGDSRGVLPQPPPIYIIEGLLFTYAKAFTLPPHPPASRGPIEDHFTGAVAIVASVEASCGAALTIEQMSREAMLIKNRTSAAHVAPWRDLFANVMVTFLLASSTKIRHIVHCGIVSEQEADHR
jgi:hypothetical protein